MIGGLLAPTRTKAQDNWNQGRLVLQNNQVLEGAINYNWKAEVVQVRQGGRTRAFSAQQVAAFDFYDMQNNMLRHFVTLEYPVQATRMRPVLVEKVAEGPFAIYRRLRTARDLFRVNRPQQYGSDTGLLQDDDNFDYVVQTPGGFVKMDQFQQDVLPTLMAGKMGSQIRQYIRSHQLDTNSTTTRLMLLVRYNALMEDTALQEEQQRRGISGE